VAEASATIRATLPLEDGSPLIANGTPLLLSLPTVVEVPSPLIANGTPHEQHLLLPSSQLLLPFPTVVEVPVPTPALPPQRPLSDSPRSWRTTA